MHHRNPAARALAASALALGLALAGAASAEESGPPSGPPAGKPPLPDPVRSFGTYDVAIGGNQNNGVSSGGANGAMHFFAGDSGSNVTWDTTLSPLASVTATANEPYAFGEATANPGLIYTVSLTAANLGAANALEDYLDGGGVIGHVHGDYSLSVTGQGQAQAGIYTGFNIAGLSYQAVGANCASNGAACGSGTLDVDLGFSRASNFYSGVNNLTFVSAILLGVSVRAGASGLSFLSGSASGYVDPMAYLDFSGSGLDADDYQLTINGGVANASADGFTPSTGSGVPEPATWALMIAGFGLAGAAVRRRRPCATA